MRSGIRAALRSGITFVVLGALLGELALGRADSEQVWDGIQAWTPGNALPIALHESRDAFWNLGMLSNAIVNRNFEQMAPLMAKLEAGEPIHVVSLGSSITAEWGGMFYSDEDYLRSTVGSFKLYATRHETGWLSEFMAIINSTWPHPHHILTNAAQPGACASNFARDECLEQYMPDQVDLAIFESLSFLGPPSCSVNGFEELLARIRYHAGHLPAVITIETLRVAYGDHEDPCIREGRDGPLQPGGLCDTECGDVFLHNLTEDSYAGSQGLNENEMNAAADYYGLGTVSMRNFLWAMFRDGVPESLGVSECNVLNFLYNDEVHPSGNGGCLLFAHILVNYMAEAQAWLRRADKEGASISRQFPQRTLSHQSRVKHAVMRCYGDSYHGGWGSDDMIRAGRHEHNATRPSKAWRIAKNDGWQFVVHQVHGEVKKYKPGWVATAPGSVLHLHINTKFDGTPPDEQSVVFVTYLQSYEHMGSASISCVSGCACAVSRVDAHAGDVKASVPAHARLLVTQDKDCILSIEVLPETTSGEHKFKIIHTSVKVDAVYS